MRIVETRRVSVTVTTLGCSEVVVAVSSSDVVESVAVLKIVCVVIPIPDSGVVVMTSVVSGNEASVDDVDCVEA